MPIEKYIRDIQGFPKEGILFKDITPLLMSPQARKKTLEIHIDAIQKGDRILIHDDVLATGGTVKAVCELVEQLGGIIVQCNFLMELAFLHGRDKIKGQEVFAAITY